MTRAEMEKLGRELACWVALSHHRDGCVRRYQSYQDLDTIKNCDCGRKDLLDKVCRAGWIK